MSVLDKEILRKFREAILDLESDYTAEAIVAGLVHHGIPDDQIVIVNRNTAKRPCRKDVSGFHTEFVEYDDKEYLFIHANRDGIYDSLPENLFHQEKRGNAVNKYEIIEQIRFQKRQEADARKFFLPLEYEYHKVRQLLYSLEEDFEKNTDNARLISVFAVYWPVLKRLEKRQAWIFLRIIPMINAIRNTIPLVEQSMGLILNTVVKIEARYQKNHPPDELPLFSLSDSLLGHTTILSGAVCSGEQDLVIKVRMKENAALGYYINGGTQAGLVEEIADFFLGANYFFTVQYEHPPAENDCILGNGQACLGQNFTLA